jgi:hypothetical protein
MARNLTFAIYNSIVMKKVVFIIVTCILISGCSTTKEARISRAEKRQSIKIAEQSVVKKAVESRRYIIRMERIYLMNGGFLELVPKNNFIIVDGGATSISLGYVGRNFGTRAISGINLNGQTIKYELESNEEKGIYKINMGVRFRNDEFDLYFTIGSDGNCHVSVINSNIQSVSYSGQLVPLGEPLHGTGNAGKTERL